VPEGFQEQGLEGAAKWVVATLVERLAGERALLGLERGETLEIPLPETLGQRIEIGDSVEAYFDSAGELLGWYCPRIRAGVDLRIWEDRPQ
jgi:hypothetical protein